MWENRQPYLQSKFFWSNETMMRWPAGPFSSKKVRLIGVRRVGNWAKEALLAFSEGGTLRCGTVRGAAFQRSLTVNAYAAFLGQFVLSQNCSHLCNRIAKNHSVLLSFTCTRSFERSVTDCPLVVNCNVAWFKNLKYCVDSYNTPCNLPQSLTTELFSWQRVKYNPHVHIPLKVPNVERVFNESGFAWFKCWKHKVKFGSKRLS